MGFKARERKRRRRKRIASNNAQAAARKFGSSADKWWLTIATRKGCCANVECRQILPEGAEIVYRHRPTVTFCLRCATRDGVPYRPSVRWEATRRQRQRKGASAA